MTEQLNWTELMGPHAFILVFWMLRFKPAFSLSPFTFIKRLFKFITFCHKGGVICISEVIDISPSNLDSSLCFIHPGISHDVLCIDDNKQGDNIQPWQTPFPILEQSDVSCPVLFFFFSCPVLTATSWPAYRFLRRQVRWSGFPISWQIFHSLLWPTQSKTLA